MGKICALFGKTRQGWYDGMTRADEEQVCDRIIYYEIKRIRIKQPNSGLLKLYEPLKPFFERWGISMGRDKLADFMCENGLFIRKKAYRVYTTHSFHRFHKYPNKTLELALNKRNQLWVTDITYVRLISVKEEKGEFAYLSLITDAYPVQNVNVLSLEVLISLTQNPMLQKYRKVLKFLQISINLHVLFKFQ